MKLGIVIYTPEAETAWNALRLGIFALKQGDSVRLFLLARGVECEKLDTERFAVSTQMREFLGLGGDILACGTCLKLRHSEGSELCPVSTMKDLYEIVRDSDRVVTF
ncbi:DsrE family protein [Sulfuricaulis limicola]|uniref:DsrE family protein n=1 Tax=Sulfuricaulis limicola TaxID=1620215 RepID=A0A1B4XJK4_9GAMM|nr:DsrE family protein [Sulfuricaulis limicola]BAV34977.1 DsrE family protein [Sulfuricaulis limicola]